jgi:hypothetical protein
MPRSRVRVPLSPPIKSNSWRSSSEIAIPHKRSVSAKSCALQLLAGKRSIFRTLRLELTGQQRLDVLDCLRSRQLGEQAAQVRIRFELVRPRGLYQAVKMGTRLGAAHRIGEQPVAAPKGKGADRILGEIGVDGDSAVLSVADELGPLLEQIRERFAEFP